MPRATGDAPGGDHSGHRQRLRDRFKRGGGDALPDYELLELLLFYAIPRQDTKPLAKRLLDRFGGIGGVLAAPLPQLSEAGCTENVTAFLKAIEAAGGVPFTEYQLPQAVIKLKQGFGRLIRTRSDTGMVVILDPRVLTKGYGRAFLDALPECRRFIDGVAGTSSA